MSSPIHRYLFSPPASPPSYPSYLSSPDPNHGLTSLRSLLPDLIPRSSFDNGINKRSPRTPQLGFSTAQSVFFTPQGESDSEVTPRGVSRLRGSSEKGVVGLGIASSTYQPVNVPSTRLPIPSTLPKPLLRLLFLATVLCTSILILVFVPSARLPSLDLWGLHGSGKPEVIVTFGNAVDFDGLEDGINWAPPQSKGSRMFQGKKEKANGHVIQPVQMHADSPVVPHPKTTRPSLRARPIPSSHELLALQSYILSSSYNTIPDSVDPSKPLDANAILGVGAHKLGEVGGEKEMEWLQDIEGEWEDEVVVWYGGDGKSQLPHAALDVINAAHNSGRHPTFVPLHSRPDKSTILAILSRLGLSSSETPIIMIGNEAVVGDAETLEGMRLSGELQRRLGAIGWKMVEKKVATKLKMAVVVKKTAPETEEEKFMA